MNYVSLISFSKFGNFESGFLSYFQPSIDFGFEIKRIYYIFNTKSDYNRGFHAHKHLKQIMFCPYGKIKVTIRNGESSSVYILDLPNKGLILKKGFWREIEYLESNSILIVAASDFYDENDYIRNYEEFLEFIKAGGYDEN
jgi:dTDP-4-dehydrorhamnose 3,5-epimerase-like enzyme